jgi:hypothetical protein
VRIGRHATYVVFASSVGVFPIGVSVTVIAPHPALAFLAADGVVVPNRMPDRSAGDLLDRTAMVLAAACRTQVNGNNCISLTRINLNAIVHQQGALHPIGRPDARLTM